MRTTADEKRARLARRIRGAAAGLCATVLAAAFALPAAGAAPVAGSAQPQATPEQISVARQIADDLRRNMVDGATADGGLSLGGAGAAASSAASAEDNVTADDVPSVYAAPVTSVKNQGTYGNCWAYSTLAAMESNMLVRSGASGSSDVQSVIDAAASRTLPDYSEASLTYATYNLGQDKWDRFKNPIAGNYLDASDTSGFNYGGNTRKTSATIAAGFGFVNDADDPMVGPVNAENVATMVQRTKDTWDDVAGELLSTIEVPAPAVDDGTGGRDLAPGNRAAIKQAIMRYGALDISYHSISSGLDWRVSHVKNAAVTATGGTVQVTVSDDDTRLNSWTADSDSGGTKTATNHGVLLAGWDDSYSRFNFMIPYTDGRGYDSEVAEVVSVQVTDASTGATTTGSYIVPREDGAWLIKNSWGTNVGNKGFQWLSYDEKTISSTTAFFVGAAEADRVTEQYDSVSSLSYSYAKNRQMLQANVFTASTDEAIDRVGIWTLDPNTRAQIMVYDLVEGTSDPTNGALVYDGKITLDYAGYHQLVLNRTFYFDRGDRYSVVVELTSLDKSYDYITLEAGHTTDIEATSSPGESFVKRGDQWIDSTLVQSQFYDGDTSYSIGNARIKAIGTTHTVATGGEPQNMMRLYNAYSGEHFYTASDEERGNLTDAGWRDEGLGWVAPGSGNAVYRLYNPVAGDHHYTTSVEERNSLRRVGWRYEGVSWLSAPENSGLPVWRQYNPNAAAGAHNYTTSDAERGSLVALGWRDEGVAWYAAAGSAGA